MKKFWNRKRIYINLYILIPLIYSGLSIIAVVVTYRLACIGEEMEAAAGPVLKWGVFIGAFSFICSLVILWLVMNPVMKFVRRTESLRLFPRTGVEEKSSLQVDRLEEMTEVLDQVTDILGKVEAREFFPRVVGQSRRMRGIFAQLLKVAPTDSTVMILGESGTGKELIADSIHEHSRRKTQPFVKINCVAIPEGLLESELFGHEKGAFTGAVSQKKGKFEQAEGGTIFLDEIGDMPMATQAKLLRVLQEREFERVGGVRPLKVDVRFIVATNKNLQELIRQGKFREDLFYRLNVFSLELPPLRERREDVPALTEYFLERKAVNARLSPEALQLLIGYSWPGNVRELQNVIERSAVMADGGLILPEHLAGYISAMGRLPAVQANGPDGASLDAKLEEIEKAFILEALARASGIQARAATLLGINQRSLWHRIKKYRIEVAPLKKGGE
ncbi:MAG: Nitrogen fixation protein VnfA [Syntrophaceae bacterium PtaU1.Bin231]|nr:MAG: Nitrogen fixation protein VnfA [Syntrophaceae bacterium PtaU1.Bin231]HOG15893.1 sigma-54 dependent transcriptional regulator [Syntrophales bacterium]